MPNQEDNNDLRPDQSSLRKLRSRTRRTGHYRRTPTSKENWLYNEAEPQFGKSNVPIVKITEAEPIKVGKGKSRELKFEIVKWVPRPTAITEALAKLREAAETTTNKKSTGTNGATQTDTGGDDFDDDVKPEAEPKKTTEKPKARAKKAQAEEAHSSDLLDDEIPFA